MKPKLFTFSPLFLTASLFLNSQNITIKGIARDELKVPLSDVSIKTNKGEIEVLTDSKGLYSISVPPKSKLIFSHQGFKNQIRIRGNRSLSSDDSPLIMLNGSQYNASLNNINPRDIKSIDVLKDASATVVYGSRGANGVILINTKQYRNHHNKHS